MTQFIFLAVLCFATLLQAAPVRVVVWDEQQPSSKKIYTNFLGNQIALYLKTLPDVSVKSVGLNDADQGLADDTLTNCDVLIWWSHVKNKLVPVGKARQIVGRVKEGRLSLIVLHSAITSRPFIEAMNCLLYTSQR